MKIFSIIYVLVMAYFIFNLEIAQYCKMFIRISIICLENKLK